MSMTSSKAPCAVCDNKSAGIFRCEGCLEVFCRKHMNEHRDALAQQLDEIVLEHDGVLQAIADDRQMQNDRKPLLTRIDQWEQDSLQKVQQLANELRQQVADLPNPRQALSTNLRALAEQLQTARTNDDYMEHDLQLWKTTLQAMKRNLDSFSTSVRMEESLADNLVAKMRIINKSTPKQTLETFQETSGDVSISENGLLATHGESANSNVCVRGSGTYSSGIYCFRFVLQRSSGYIATFGIMSKQTRLYPLANHMSSHIFGWNSNDSVSGRAHPPLKGKVSDLANQMSLEIELELNCDNQKIIYVNQRTKCRRELDVDPQLYPFPWQVCFYLYERGASVRLLPIDDK